VIVIHQEDLDEIKLHERPGRPTNAWRPGGSGVTAAFKAPLVYAAGFCGVKRR
jgi:hypothetical protein